jgi:Nucleotidyl transferase AbiEii toxin, Type IV TA system
MRLSFLTLPADERRLYLDQAATRRNVSAVVLEKDFWVCWLLGLLFGSEFAASLVFKGGTSLSKVFGVIDRFSEDIDLSLSPEFLKLPEAGSGTRGAEQGDTPRHPATRPTGGPPSPPGRPGPAAAFSLIRTSLSPRERGEEGKRLSLVERLVLGAGVPRGNFPRVDVLYL